MATNEFRGQGATERTEYHNLVAWDRLAEICGQFLSKGQLDLTISRDRQADRDSDSEPRRPTMGSGTWPARRSVRVPRRRE